MKKNFCRTKKKIKKVKTMKTNKIIIMNILIEINWVAVLIGTMAYCAFCGMAFKQICV